MCTLNESTDALAHNAIYYLLTKGETRWYIMTNFYSGNKTKVIICLLTERTVEEFPEIVE